MSNNDLIRRGEVREAFSDELYSVFGINDSFVDNIIDSIPAVPQESTWKNKIDGTEWVSHKIDTGVEIHFCTTDNDKAEMVERACHNAVDNVPQEMSARELLHTEIRMFSEYPDAWNVYSDHVLAHREEEAVQFAEKWEQDHPEKKRKTYKEDFLEKFPEVQMRFDEEHTMSRPVGCRMNIYGIEGPCTGRNCFSCWNEVMEGEDE